MQKRFLMRLAVLPCGLEDQMQQAIERVTKSLDAYEAGALSRSLAKIELVSAFKVVARNLSHTADDLHESVEAFIEGLLARLDEKDMNAAQVTDELARVYEAAHNNDPNIMAYISSSR